MCLGLGFFPASHSLLDETNALKEQVSWKSAGIFWIMQFFSPQAEVIFFVQFCAPTFIPALSCTESANI